MLECGQEVWEGVRQDFSNRIPLKVEQDFLPLVFNELSLLTPPSFPLNLPLNDSLLGGLHRGSLRGLDLPFTKGAGLFVMGTSMVSEMKCSLERATRDLGFNVIISGKGGDFFKNLEYFNFPQSNDPLDTLILSFLGNNSFKNLGHTFKNGTWHLEQPGFLNDKDINGLIDKIVSLIAKIRTKFQGRIKLLGPLPRSVKPCCHLPNHLLKPSLLFPSPVIYFLYLNQFLFSHPKLRFLNFEFIPFYQFFGKNIPHNFTRDGVHLSTKEQNRLVGFFTQLPGRKPVTPPAPTEELSFLAWVDNNRSAKISPSAIESSSISPGSSLQVAVQPRAGCTAPAPSEIPAPDVLFEEDWPMKDNQAILSSDELAVALREFGINIDDIEL